MTKMRNYIEAAVLGESVRFPLRSVDDFNWVHHLAMSSVFYDRHDYQQATTHVRKAALLYVASLQLMADEGNDKWFHISREDIASRHASFVPVTRMTKTGLFTAAYDRFKDQVAFAMTTVAPYLETVCAVDDLSMMSNVYLNAVRSMPGGAGIYFREVADKEGFQGVVIHRGKDRMATEDVLSARHARSAIHSAVSYYSILASQLKSGAIILNDDEREAARNALDALDRIIAARREPAANDIDAFQQDVYVSSAMRA